MLEFFKKISDAGLGTLLLQLLSFLIVAIILPKVLVRLPAATHQAFDWLKGRAKTVKNAFAAGVLQRLADLIAQKVLKVENTIIEDLKEKAKDGKMTKAELLDALANAKKAALEAVKADATAQGLWSMAIEVFLGDENALGRWLGDTLEATVAKLPPSGLQTSATPGVKPAAAGLPPGTPVAPAVP